MRLKTVELATPLSSQLKKKLISRKSNTSFLWNLLLIDIKPASTIKTNLPWRSSSTARLNSEPLDLTPSSPLPAKDFYTLLMTQYLELLVSWQKKNQFQTFLLFRGITSIHLIRTTKWPVKRLKLASTKTKKQSILPRGSYTSHSSNSNRPIHCSKFFQMQWQDCFSPRALFRNRTLRSLSIFKDKSKMKIK